MDVDIDPCEDFYQFSCGGWIKNNPRPANKDYWSIFSSLKTKVMKRIKVILDDHKKNDNLALPMIKAQNFYKSCIDTDNRDRYAIQGIKTLLRKLSGCPLIDTNWNEKSYDWQNSLSVLLIHRTDKVTIQQKY
ncbi:neprilysin-like protein [Leptotrombidium deliense]|uniref:Neprilysin-like protein n=1 Tax=Leptotrombidium deliense TaxID=299467 RepID=A0A443S6W2_9ACAR|nr:neprilysin-like protein [Leptotrombidium deliense]